MQSKGGVAMVADSRRWLVQSIGWLFAVLTMASALVVLGCGGSSGGGQAAATMRPPTGVGPATLQLVNASNEAIYYIHMSPTAQSTWGPDLLGSQVLQRGQSFTISNITPGQWDLRVIDASQNYKEWRGEYLEAGGAYSLEVTSGGWSR
jgi:hypothetical protein